MAPDLSCARPYGRLLALRRAWQRSHVEWQAYHSALAHALLCRLDKHTPVNVTYCHFVEQPDQGT